MHNFRVRPTGAAFRIEDAIYFLGLLQITTRNNRLLGSIKLNLICFMVGRRFSLLKMAQSKGCPVF
jgi:hypothetical protein